jgi:hypothetical protein
MFLVWNKEIETLLGSLSDKKNGGKLLKIYIKLMLVLGKLVLIILFLILLTL